MTMICNHAGLENRACYRCGVVVNPKVDYQALEAWLRGKARDKRMQMRGATRTDFSVPASRQVRIECPYCLASLVTVPGEEIVICGFCGTHIKNYRPKSRRSPPAR